MKKLSECEFDVMKTIWESDGYIASSEIVEKLSNRWKQTTILTFLSRLCTKGFLESKKKGKENLYKSLVESSNYLKFEGDDLMRRYDKSSALNLIQSMYQDEPISDDELNEIMDWVKNRRQE